MFYSIVNTFLFFVHCFLDNTCSDMADSEAKARQKLEEAQKKQRGGGGFLGKIFGGGGAEEAADLYIQVSIIILFSLKLLKPLFP